jgi:hypothetical protein
VAQAVDMLPSVPMDYYRVLSDIRAAIPKESVIVNEGANTMDMYDSSRIDSKQAIAIAIAIVMTHSVCVLLSARE